MKKTIGFTSLAFLVVLITSSCKKDTTTVFVPTTDTLYLSTTDNSVLGLLTQKQWEADTTYTGYTGPGTGTLAYVRGGSSNILSLDNEISVFWPDGSASFFDNSGNYSADSWTLSGSDSTAMIILQQGNPAIHGKILKLDATHFTLFDSTNSALDIEIYKR
jgi:hypothetical protein